MTDFLRVVRYGDLVQSAEFITSLMEAVYSLETIEPRPALNASLQTEDQCSRYSPFREPGNSLFAV